MKPETQTILITRADGSVRVMLFVTKGLLNAAGDVFEREATAAAIEAEIAKAGFTDTVGWRLIAPADIPQDRYFRDAWGDAGEGRAMAIDMTKAREIHKQHLRELRAPLLTKLDVDFQRALEAEDKVAMAEIAAKKQALRDVTDDPAISGAKTPDALKAALPDALRTDLEIRAQR